MVAEHTRRTWRTIALAVVYLLLGAATLAAPFADSNATLLWPPMGWAVFAVARWRLGAVPGLWLGSMALHLFWLPTPWHLAPTLAALDAAAPLLGVALLRRRKTLYPVATLPELGAFAVWACLLPAATTAAGAALLLDAGQLTWPSRFVADALGAVLLAPALLATPTDGRTLRAHLDQRALLIMTVVITTTGLALTAPLPSVRVVMLLPVPLVVWAAAKGGPLIGTWAGLAVATTVIGVASARGFAGGTSVDDRLHTWVYLAVVGSVTVLSAVVEEGRRRAARRAQEQTARLRALFEASPVGIAYANPAGVITDCNPCFASLVGAPVEAIVGRPFAEHTHPDDLPLELTAFADLVAGRIGQYTVEKRLRSAWGAPTWVEMTAGGVRAPDGAVSHLVGIATDITARRARTAEQRLAAVAFETHEAIMITDADGVIQRVNRAFESLTGYPADEALGRRPDFLGSAHHPATFDDDLWIATRRKGHWEAEVWQRRHDGTEFPTWLTVTAVRDDHGALIHFVSVFMDISEHKTAAARIEALAYADPLTGLPNRRMALDRIERACRLGAQRGHYAVLLFIDVDRFKQVNDVLGHHVGDQLLQAIARRLESLIRAEDTVARLGGDEFVVLLPRAGADLTAAHRAAVTMGERVREALAEPVALADHPVTVTASVGAAVLPWTGEPVTAQQALARADSAMYRAKTRGRDAVAFFDPALQAANARRVQLGQALQQAIREQTLHEHVQGIFDADGRRVANELLLRWAHEGESISPDEFVPIAEETQCAASLGAWVLRQGTRLAATAFEPGVGIALNISGAEFGRPDFVDTVLTALTEAPLSGSRLTLELTEHVLLHTPDAAARLDTLRAEGVRVSLDDFGTGETSLATVRDLPLDELKLDGSLIARLPHDDREAAVTEAAIELAHRLGLVVVAEGVETEAQRAWLTARGCDRLQGYLLEHPAPPGLQLLSPPLAPTLRPST